MTAAPPSLEAVILAAQCASGAFAAIAHPPSGPVHDENAFVTALMVGHMGALAHSAAMARARERAVDFLLRCEAPARPGAFGFYPIAFHPGWIGERLGADADDTALVALALHAAGRWPRAALRRQLERVLGRYRLHARPAGAPWFRGGVYPTWLDAGRLHNPIDLCVNLNIATLIESAGAGADPAHGHHGIMAMAAAALEWIGDSAQRAGAVTPYYPHPAELVHALERCARAGVAQAPRLLDQARARPWSTGGGADDTPVCCSLGAAVVWTCPLLQAVRRQPRYIHLKYK